MAFTNNYVVGKGRTLFQPYPMGARLALPGVGFKYFGNTPTFEMTRTNTSLDHMDSDGGVKVIDESIDIETKFTGKFSCDNINGDNLAFWFGGRKDTATQTSGSALTETITGAMADNYYQIGAVAGDPSGIRGVTGFAATTGTGSPVTLVAGTDYDFDSMTGFLHILAGGAITAPANVNLTYTLASMPTETVIEQGQPVFGALKFIANNPKGKNRDYLIPYCKISADGTFALKGDTWQVLGFSFEAMKRDSQTARVYIDGQAA